MNKLFGLEVIENPYIPKGLTVFISYGRDELGCRIIKDLVVIKDSDDPGKENPKRDHGGARHE